MGPEISISAVTSANPQILKELAALEIVAWTGKADLQAIETKMERLSDEFNHLDSDTKMAFVARGSGLIVGVGRIIRTCAATYSWMTYGLAVHPEYRRQGIGRALLRARLEYARERGAQTIQSETHAANLASIAFHEAVGFINQGTFLATDGDPKIAFSMSVVKAES